MYTFDSRVRYSETDESGHLSPLSAINYLQDCSTFQSEMLGVGVQWLRDHHRAWFLNSWRILADRYPALGEKIRIGTFAYGFKGIYGYRHFFIQDEAGNFPIRADSIWFLVDTDTGMPTRPTEEYTTPYMADPEQVDLHMGETKRKIPLPKELQQIGEIRIQRHHLDTNHHVNNAQYVDIALDAAGIHAPWEIQAEYRRAAVLGDTLSILTGKESEGRQVISLADREGNPYAVVRCGRKGACSEGK